MTCRKMFYHNSTKTLLEFYRFDSQWKDVGPYGSLFYINPCNNIFTEEVITNCNIYIKSLLHTEEDPH